MNARLPSAMGEPKIYLGLAITFLAIAAIACGDNDLPLESQQQFDSDLVQRLEDQGITTADSTVHKPEQCLSLSPTKSYTLSSGGRVHLYAFDSESAAETAAGQMPPPSTCGTIDWVVDVRYFLCRDLIAFVTNEDESVLSILTEQCGKPFGQVAARFPSGAN